MFRQQNRDVCTLHTMWDIFTEHVCSALWGISDIFTNMLLAPLCDSCSSQPPGQSRLSTVNNYFKNQYSLKHCQPILGIIFDWFYTFGKRSNLLLLPCNVNIIFRTVQIIPRTDTCFRHWRLLNERLKFMKAI